MNEDLKNNSSLWMSVDNIRNMASWNLAPSNLDTKESKDNVPTKETINKDAAWEILTVCNIFLPPKD